MGKGRKNNRRKDKEDKYRVNEEIRAYEVRVIDENGNNLGVMNLRKAIELAYNKGLDLVEIAPNANPPVCKIVDYGKFKYEMKKKKKKRGKSVEVKEITFSMKIDKHDLEVKIKRAREFLEEGHKVKLRLIFRGREIIHQDVGKEVMEKFLEGIKDIAKIDQYPRLEGRNLFCIVSPSKTKGG